MASAKYYRKQAESCFQLARQVTGEVSHKLLAMAEDFLAKAERAEAEPGASESKDGTGEAEEGET